MNKKAWIPLISMIAFSASTVAAEPPAEYFFSNSELTIPLESRARITRNDPLEVFVNVCDVIDVKFEEEERHTRIHDDLNTIIGILKKDDKSENLDKCEKSHKAYPHKLQHTRARVTIKAFGRDDPTIPVATRVVVTGPKEHLYIGVDLPVDRMKILKYDAETQGLVPKETNTQLYLSLNYQLGDIAGRRKGDSLTDDISVKLLVRASKRPLDSVGVGLSFRLPERLFGKGLNNVSIFGGHFWNRQDIITDGVADPKGDTAKGWRVGVTYDIGSALKYFKKKD